MNSAQCKRSRGCAPHRFLAAFVTAAAALVMLLSAPAAARAQNATTIQLPTFGVSIDAAGVLRHKHFADPGGRLARQRLAAAKAALPADLQAKSGLRKVSLVRLERAIEKRLAAGEQPTNAMRNLAGLQRIEYVFCYPKTGELIIAGPAEGWVADAAGRSVGLTTGRPVMQLEDLLVALRAYGPGRPLKQFIGCTIDPDPKGLAKLVEFQRTIPKVVSQRQRGAVAAYIARGMRDSLGMANVRVFGISPKTHFARVLVEADYRMKLIGIGLEPPPVNMHTFMSALRGANHGSLQRWWFVPDYQCARVSQDRLSLQLVGEGVKLLSEDKLIGKDGKLAPATAAANPASTLFTTTFTKKYDEIAVRRPVYAQMRTLIDMLVAAAFIRQQDFYGKLGWRMGTLGEEQLLPTETTGAPKQAPAAVNVAWKGSRLFSPAGGGVSIRPAQALEPTNVLADDDGRLDVVRGKVSPPADDRWWWD